MPQWLIKPISQNRYSIWNVDFHRFARYEIRPTVGQGIVCTANATPWVIIPVVRPDIFV